MNINKYKITISICTYNRAFFLDYCLDSLYMYGADNDKIEVIVIDNNSNDNTAEITKNYISKYNNIKYILEKNLGLSYARNRTIKESASPYIAYLDDDVKISNNYIKRLLWDIENIDFDCLGGMYYPWYVKSKPKWFPDEFGTKRFVSDIPSIVIDENMPGLNIVFKKKTLESIGGFPINFGMVGNKTYYGEENYVQEKIRQSKGIIFFDPDLYVFHAVQEFKYSVWWQLNSHFLNAKTGYMIQKKENLVFILFQLTKSIFASLFKRIPLGLYRLIFKKNYYYQNFIYSNTKYICVNIGKLSGYLAKIY